MPGPHDPQVPCPARPIADVSENDRRSTLKPGAASRRGSTAVLGSPGTDRVEVFGGDDLNIGEVGEVRILTVAVVAANITMLTTGCTYVRPAVVEHGPQFTPAILFDRHAGVPTANQMAYRSGWPSTLSLYQLGESVYYRERFIDIQEAGPRGRGRLGHTYRRFDTIREGSGVR